MRLMAFDADDVARPVDALYFDGYCIGERRLEGLPIKIALTPDGKALEVTADWPRGLDVEHWTELAREHALEADVLSRTPEMADDDGFIEFDQDT